MSSNRAVFIDRDGTLIVNAGYINSYSSVEIYNYSFEAVKLFNDAGFTVIIATNQSAIARGLATEEEVQVIHEYMDMAFAAEECIIDEFYYAPCHPEGTVKMYRKASDLRKPAPGMLLQGADDFDIDLKESFMIGDSLSDIEAGINAGTQTALVRTGYGVKTEKEILEKSIKVEYIGDTLLDVARMICK